MSEHSAQVPQPDRRSFLKSALSVVIGGLVTVVPLAAGLLVYLDPLRRRGKGGGGTGYIPVTPLGALPADDKPRKFEVITDRVDAWTKTQNVAVGAVFLKRTKGEDGNDQVTAWNVVCPHAGCFIDVAADNKSFRCPCHNSSFHPNGDIVVGQCVSPRGMDTLEVDPDGLASGEVRVKFQNFVAGTHDKRPVT